MHTNETSPSGEGELRPAVSSTGTDSTPTPLIAPEDQPIADQILAMDPLDVPSSNKWPAGRKAPPMVLTALNPEMRKEAQAKLATLPAHEREGAEARVVTEVMRAHTAYSPAAGRSAYELPYHGEQRQIALDYRELEREFDGLSAELSEVQSYGTERGPETGETRPVEILRIQGPRREGYLNRMAELSRRMRLLHDDQTDQPGLEGARRLREAHAESVRVVKAREAAFAEREAAKVLAADMARDERIKRHATALASFQKGSDY